jgi:putative polymerase
MSALGLRHEAMLPPAPAIHGARAQAFEADSAGAWLTILILLTLSYHLGLCALNTHAAVGGRAVVAAAEFALLLAALPLVARRVSLGYCLVLALILANAVALALVRQSFDPKPLRDLLVPLLFLGAAVNVSSESTADRILGRAVWLVLAVALFEFYFLDLFTRLFDVHSYYLARGVGDPDMSQYRTDSLVASGMRPETIGRTLLPVLGPHRASSVFLEPVSFGNFAVLCAAWGLAKAREHWRTGLFFVAAAAAMVVLADSRFGLLTIGMMVALRLIIPRGAHRLAIALPLVGVAALVLVVLLGDGLRTDTFLGRLTVSGQTLMAMGGREMLGLTGPSYGYFDMGYPYMLANFGLLATLLLWGTYWLLPMTDGTGQRFQTFAGLYLALILCVSGTSAFAFKTSALLGFLLGSLAADGAPRAVRDA